MGDWLSTRRQVGLGLILAVMLIGGAAADCAVGWVEPAFDSVAHLFYEVPLLAKIRRPSQVALIRVHLPIWLAMVSAGYLLAPRLRSDRRAWWGIFCIGYAIRAVCWILGGNLPLVPGDSCHALEVASSVYRGEGHVKHYVDSFFIDYTMIGQGKPVLDDWATPLYSSILAPAYRIVGVVPGETIEPTVAVAKGVSFLLSLACLPALYLFARRRFGAEVGLLAMGALAVLPVHAIYAGFALRESLVAFTSILAIWTLTETWQAGPRSRWGWAISAGLLGGLAILSRNTALALMAGAGLYGLIVHGRRHLGPMLAWGIALTAVITPWALETNAAYGSPFYTMTKYFPYNFSWTVHHFDRGNTRPEQFYTRANAPEIARVKLKSLLIIPVYSTMILSVPFLLGFARSLRRPDPDIISNGGLDAGRLVLVLWMVFFLATLANIADVTQVAQLGRYYLPLFVLALPSASSGLLGWARESVAPAARPWLAAALVPLLWAAPSWAYDATWFVSPYQLHWPALRGAGDWVRAHPDLVPGEARIMTWFPWEFRLASQRTTILLPRSYHLPHIERTARQYGVTHILWGSFEPPPDVDPENWGPYLEKLRLAAGLTDRNEIYRTPRDARFPYYPVRLYRLAGPVP